MGGAYTLVVREDNGKVHSRQAYTRSIPDTITHCLTIQKKMDHFLKYFEKCSLDEISPTPSGYGIVVVDYLTSNILSCQGFSGIGDESYAGISLSLPRYGQPAFDDNQKKFDDLFALGNCKLFIPPYDGPEEIIPIKAKSVDEFFKEFPREEDHTKKRHRYECAHVMFDFSSFKIWHELHDSKANLRRLKKKMNKLQIPIDNNEWDDYIKQMDY